MLLVLGSVERVNKVVVVVVVVVVEGGDGRVGIVDRGCCRHGSGGETTRCGEKVWCSTSGEPR